jgi:hypothetical protein
VSDKVRALVLGIVLAVTPAQAQEATAAAVIAASKIDSSIFTDAFFGYTSAAFQRAWHRAWNAPSARVVQWSPVEHGKTQQVTGWAFHRLGRDPVNARILWIGAAQKTALKSTGIIKQSIEQPSRFLRTVFPDLRPGRKKWTQAQFTLSEAKTTEKDCSVETAGVESQILGGRFTDIVLDDICTFETTFTQQQREKVTKWLVSTVLGRLLDGGRIVCLGNAWYPDDVMHALAERGFSSIHEEAYRETEDGSIVPESILWPEQWPLERLGPRPGSERKDGSPSKRRELGTVEALRQLRCIPYSAGQGRFKLDWFDAAMAAGRQLTFVEEYHGPWPTFMGVDLGVQAKEGHDAWGFWVMAVNPETKQRRVLNALEERMEGPAGIRLLKDWHRRYGAVIMVENNAAQEFIRQFAKEQGLPTRPFTTGKNKADPAFGVPSLGVELEQGMWVLPCGDEASQKIAIKWRTQCLAFAPGQHTGDLLMASWFAREACRSDVATATSPAPPAPTAGRVDYGRVRARYGGRG